MTYLPIQGVYDRVQTKMEDTSPAHWLCNSNLVEWIAFVFCSFCQFIQYGSICFLRPFREDQFEVESDNTVRAIDLPSQIRVVAMQYQVPQIQIWTP
jgi:hypothetical protein